MDPFGFGIGNSIGGRRRRGDVLPPGFSWTYDAGGQPVYWRGNRVFDDGVKFYIWRD
ncbi:hypothetical protein HDIA_2284 [Hartmannibacter diazotrophicus]|uniref:Uncharacterized protein n=1 Tax=Hartmannibacter diazotrophicus TaxID=1482074 RepID=A0A2C9D8E5_9HYPH|nr:hypothetical protein [Hartmannibacter diazotrophicus]SON55825.1 hypothetical protein HDIA_2284 [Hartmannibacter diazotrophicus]